MLSQSLSNNYFRNPPSSVLVLSMMVWNTRLVCWGQLPEAVSLPNLLFIPQPAHWDGRVRNRESLGAAQQ